MLSATFFRSAFDKLFYMIRMLRSPLPRTMEFLPTLIHEHVLCEVPETSRTWEARRSWTCTYTYTYTVTLTFILPLL